MDDNRSAAATAVASLPSPTPASTDFLARLLAGDTTVTLPEEDGCEPRAFRLQFSLLGVRLLNEKYSSFEKAQELILALVAGGQSMARLGELVEALEAGLQSILARFHPDPTDDDLDDVTMALGGIPELRNVLGLLINHWIDRDGLGDQLAGLDPVVEVGGVRYRLRFQTKAAKALVDRLRSRGTDDLTLGDLEHVLRAALQRFHPQLAAGEDRASLEILDDLSWVLGAAGLTRLVTGKAAAGRAVAEGAADPNAPGAPAPQPGTSEPSS